MLIIIYEKTAWQRQSSLLSRIFFFRHFKEQRAEVINWSKLPALPVGFPGLKATKEKTKVLPECSTVGEENTRDFLVEHSSNGKDWNEIGTVIAVENSTSMLYYSLTHMNPIPGNNYYRLLQRDLDHFSEFSKIVLLKYVAAGKQITAYPNPAVNGIVNIQLRQAELVMIYNSAAMLVLQKQLPAPAHNNLISAGLPVAFTRSGQ